MSAWHSGTLADLLEADLSSIAATLAAKAIVRSLSPTPESFESWFESLGNLRDAAESLVERHAPAAAWHYFVEFEIPRRARRIDAVLLADDVIFIFEWKVGADRFDRGAIWQAEQYALDMRDFHEGSRLRRIIPLLVATKAEQTVDSGVTNPDRLVQPVRTLAPTQIADRVLSDWRSLHQLAAPSIDASAWEAAAYRPTPTIIEAAQMLYEQHNVKQLSISGAQNLDQTVDAVLELIEVCRTQRRRGIAFITGSPGSGKTLAGLQVVHDPRMSVGADGEANGVFLSGNMPLVEVVRAALTDSEVKQGRRKHEAQRQVSTFIQHAYLFRNAYAVAGVPPEHVVLFDEAQRAWDRKQVLSWTRKAVDRSEPEILLDVMNRKDDWSVVVAMVGGGQEINSGEAGLGEWGRALLESHSDWLIRASPQVLSGSSAPPPGGRLFESLGDTQMQVAPDTRLHLQMNVRSPRAERLNSWVDALLELRIDDARAATPDPNEFPMAYTRSLDRAKEWLREHCDEDQRKGLLASADARRLRAWGLDPRNLRAEKAWADWFLKPKGDVRSSDQLEVPANNFDCQGLEIDWAGVCWGNDFSAGAADQAWRIRRFTGSRWTNPNSETRRYILNGYHVLLTRARRGQIIWVPRPDGTDATLAPKDFDDVADLLAAVGVPSID